MKTRPAAPDECVKQGYTDGEQASHWTVVNESSNDSGGTHIFYITPDLVIENLGDLTSQQCQEGVMCAGFSAAEAAVDKIIPPEGRLQLLGSTLGLLRKTELPYHVL